jgi:integrase
VQALYEHIIDIGRPKSAKSIDMVVNVLRLVLAHAIRQKLIEHNCVDAWRGQRSRRRSSTSSAVPPSKVLSHEELERVLEIAQADFPAFYPLILLLADTGLRLGEAIALRWVDVCLEARTARICRSFSSGVRLGPTKTGRERTVELSSRLVMCLARIEPNVFPHPVDSLVFPNAKGTFLWAPNFRNKIFSKVIAKALGPGRRFSPHCLRHTWASLHMARGTPLKWIQDQGGWSTAKLLLDTYGHYMPSESHGFADAISEAPNGTQTAPLDRDDDPPNPLQIDSSGVPVIYDEFSSPTTPRSPIMHFTLPPPFLRNSLTSIVIGVTPRSRTCDCKRSEIPAGIKRNDSSP